ncbi:D-ribose pyranase [Musicola paradisiaca]|uniref:D-ribose pyranase n=1 Tax=Musicola paradisiaca (strain Ech703) TaxID=579405 RepID=C6C6C2_MUSP7|nr:D-ribose pyranase [Musicola paradisiaca]ACS87731.1 RbsD or FucU transport [Musicola paradisiaca Ech703]
MKKGVLLNAEVSAVISRLGHTDQLTIADAGLPIPDSTVRIDLALTHNVPGFMQVLDVVTAEMQVEAAILAEEIIDKNPQLHDAILNHLQQLEQHQGNSISIDYVSHEAFKQQSGESRAIVRSGECSPYANVILCAGVTF